MLYIAPIWAVRPPACRVFGVGIGGFLDLHRVGNPHPAQPEGSMLHAQWRKNFLALEIAQCDSRDPLDDLGGEQDPHALITELRAGGIQQGSGASALDELAERSVGAAKF